MGTKIRWGRVILAAVLAEVAVIVVLLAAITTYSFVTGDTSESLGQDFGYYLAPPAGFVATLLMVLWVARALDSGFVANGLMVGLVSVVLTFGFIFTVRPEDRLMYGVSFALRIVGGYAGGIVAQRMRTRSQVALKV